MKQHPDTLCVQAGWQPKNGEPRVLPLYQSTTFKYDSSEHVGDLFDLKVPGHFYTRLSNPTAEAVDRRASAGSSTTFQLSPSSTAVMRPLASTVPATTERPPMTRG